MSEKTEYAARRGKTTQRAASVSDELLEGEQAASGTEEPSNAGATAFTRYAEDPAGFARDVLGSVWWSAQTEIAASLVAHRRVAVKAANGVGKTYLAADLALWFLYSHVPSVVLTTAPTWRQVESLLWEEIRRRWRAVNARAAREPGRPTLPGCILQTRLKIAEAHFAMGLSTDEPVRFQGFHAEHLLVILDEACGVPEAIWEAVEGICVSGNNRVLAISNPLAPMGRFYSIFQQARWRTLTISALAHPNITSERASERVPGAVTREAIADRIAEWCEPDGPDIPLVPTDGVALTGAETFVWEGQRYRPNPLFRARVLGEFPTSAEDSLIDLDWIEAAMRRGEQTQIVPADVPMPCILGVDVARFGADETVIALRRGERVTRIIALRGLDTMAVAGRVIAVAQEERADIVTVDEIGVGAGVVDRLRESGVAGLVGVNVSRRPLGHDADRFLNQRAQAYWHLRERFRMNSIHIPRDARLAAQLAALRYHFTSAGQIQIESKDDIRKRGLSSPDRADALALLFSPAIGGIGLGTMPAPRPLIADPTERAVPIAWDEVEKW